MSSQQTLRLVIEIYNYPKNFSHLFWLFQPDNAKIINDIKFQLFRLAFAKNCTETFLRFTSMAFIWPASNLSTFVTTASNYIYEYKSCFH